MIQFIYQNNSDEIHITSLGVSVPEDSSNLCYMAAELFLSEFNIKDRVDIVIDKNIPVGGGMGGGSSNASIVLKGLSKLFSIELDSELFHKLSIKIGADVPFFINGGLQYSEGIGDQLTPLPRLLDGLYF